MCTALAPALLLFVLAQSPDGSADDSALVKAWLKVSRDQAETYIVCSTAASDQSFRLLPQAVFRHAQPARGNDIGAVFVWVDNENRPVAIGDIFAWSVGDDAARHVTHEFHSLADSALLVRFGEREFWKPKSAGLDWKPIPDAPVPAETKAARLRQSRELARRFSANSIDKAGGRWELRLVPQPVHQFDIAQPRTTQSGALFAFCQGTDPEMWIAIESRRTDGGYRWHSACAAFTDHALQVRLDDRPMWSCEPYRHGAIDEPHWVQTLFTNFSLPDEPK
jgi:hypothetical protein